jgi:hypothetical protein
MPTIQKPTGAIPSCRLIKYYYSWHVLGVLTVEERGADWYGAVEPQQGESGK